ncbi:MAG TPA: class I SAM-dependent methyltransferase [Phycisphaerales bacterium]|nr:class I SAM-dependent methyltransferase [Phycisphaerales bacterium]
MTTDFYADPLVYDVLHAPGTAGEVAVLRRVARRFTAGRVSPLWLEPACGTGRYLIRGAKFGVRGVGFDLSEAMVEYARSRAREAGVGRRVRLRVASMESFVKACGLREGSVDFAFNLINTIRHLSSDAAMLAHFGEVARVLRRDGVYAVGLSLAAYGLESVTEDTWSGRAKGLSVTQVVQYLPPGSGGGDARRGEGQRQERVVSHVTVRRRRRGGDEETHFDSTYALRSYNLRQWLTLIERSPLEIAGVVDSSGADAAAREPGYFVFVLRRR